PRSSGACSATARGLPGSTPPCSRCGAAWTSSSPVWAGRACGPRRADTAWWPGMSEGETNTPLPSKSVLDDVVDLRRYFHEHPEVSFSEHETSRYLKDRLHELGLDLETCPTETGAVALLDTGRRGRTVMLRADIDGLPILEE